jgi:hypothetical protein
MKYMGDKVGLAALMSLMTLTVYGESAPPVGLWEKFPVSDASLKLIARPQYVFTNVKLTEKTTFTGLNPVGSDTSVLCCVVVKNLKPLNVSDVVKKYAVDADFTAQMKSVKGLSYMYEAEAVEKSAQNAYFKTVMQIDVNPDDFSPFSAAVVGARLSEKTAVKNPFKVGADSISLKVAYPKSKTSVQYEFKINDVVVKFSEAAASYE